MCSIHQKNIKLCTCLSEKELEIFAKREPLDHLLKDSISLSDQPFTWRLSKFIRHEESNIMGILRMPGESLSGILTKDYVLSQINSDNRFDFEYTPHEGDNLTILQQVDGRSAEFLSFIYNKGKWDTGRYYSFTEITETINIGHLKVDFD